MALYILQVVKADEAGNLLELRAKDVHPVKMLAKLVPPSVQSNLALVGFRGGEARTGKLGCKHLVREQRRE